MPTAETKQARLLVKKVISVIAVYYQFVFCFTVCDNCHEQGHIKRMCPKPGGGLDPGQSLEYLRL